MSLLRRLQLVENCHPFFYPPSAPSSSSSSSLFLSETLALPPPMDDLHEEVFFRGLDLLSFPPEPYPVYINDAVADLVHVETSPVPFRGSSCWRVHHRRTAAADACSDPFFLSLLERVSALEHKFERALADRAKERERKYKWTAEIEAKDVNRKYEWEAELKPGKQKKGGGCFKWVTEVKEKGEGGERTYTWTESYGVAGDKKHKKEKDKKKGRKEKGRELGTRLVEIEEPEDRGSLVLRQALARRAGAIRKDKRKKEMSPQDAAETIQMNFRAYLIRRSEALRAVRELAVAKTKLKEIRALFNCYSYRRCLSHDAEESQRFSEKIIVLLLAVEDIEGADPTVRCAQKAMVDELEAMLDIVDPPPAGRSLSTRRRTFDAADGVVKEEIADGVVRIVRMPDQEEHSTTTSET